METNTKRWFASDNNATVHPKIFEALAAANQGHAVGYGDDPFTAKAEARLAALFGAGATVRFVLNGTGANVYALGCFAGHGEAVLCSDCAHILVDETGAPVAVTGAQLLPLPNFQGKIRPADVLHTIHDYSDMHKPKPVLLSISQPTELGTVYSRAELSELCTVAHEHGLLVHIDGARLSNAAAALGCGLAEAAGLEADVVCVGGTKNGLMFGEAVVFTPRVLAFLPDTARLRKTRLQLASKMRFIATQFEAYCTDDLWKHNANNANLMAQKMAAAIVKLGIKPVYPVDTNALFVKIPAEVVSALRDSHFFYDWEGGMVRWMTSWDTTQDDIDSFLEQLGACLLEQGRSAEQSGLEGLIVFGEGELLSIVERNRQLLRNGMSVHDAPSPQTQGYIMPAAVQAVPADASRLDLPDPRHYKGEIRRFDEATSHRRSFRSFKATTISLDELSWLLWCCAGSRRPPFRTVPSAGCRHPLDLLLYIRRVEGLHSGLYRFDPLTHQLVLLRQATVLAEAALSETATASYMLDMDSSFDKAIYGQLWDCSVLFVWTAVPYRTEWRYPTAAGKLILLDAGHACQALYGACTAIGLGTCAIASYDQSKLDSLLAIDGQEELAVYVAPVGKAR